jgi:hypothetical protein
MIFLEINRWARPEMRGLQPIESNGVICAVNMLISPNWMLWTAVAGHFNPYGAPS